MGSAFTCSNQSATPALLRRPLSAAVRSALLAMACSASLGHAQQPPSTPDNPASPASNQAADLRSYQIAAGPLDEALARFAEQAGISISMPPQLLAGKQSPGLQGRHAVDAGLARLLAGTGLEPVAARAAGVYTLRAAPAPAAATTRPADGRDRALTLPEVKVSAPLDRSGATEGTGSYTTQQMRTATPLALSPRETPQSVSVITSQQIEDRGLVSLADIAQAAPGLSVVKWGGERYRFSSRGFEINNLLVDGLPIEYEEAALSTGALSMYDRAEIMRGAAGLTEGAGTPGGSINLVRKRPGRSLEGNVTASAGSWNNYTASLDVGGPLNEAGTLRGRTVVSRQDKGSFIDDTKNKRSLVYGIVEADLTASTTLTVGGSFSDEDNPGVDWNGLGTNPDGSFLPLSRSTRMSPSWSFWDKRSKTVFADLEHRLDNGWKARLAASAINSEMHMLGTYLRTPVLDSNGQTQFGLGGGGYDYDRTQRSIDAQLSGQFNAWGRAHDLVLGASHRRSRWNDVGGGATIHGNFTLGTFNPLSWDPGSIPKPTIGEFGLWARKAEMDQTSLYGMNRLALGDATKLILGARLDWFERDQAQYDGDTPYGVTHDKATRKFTPYAGLVYTLNDQYSVYASGTRIFNPQSYESADGGSLPPQTGTNFELGIKGEYLDGKLNASAAIFQIDLDNLPDALPASACGGRATSCYQSAGKVRSRGVELELSGELQPGWQVAASYTYASAKRRSPASAYDPAGTYTMGERYASNIPRTLVKLATNYRLPGDWQRWSVGGSLEVQSKTDSPWSVHQGGFAIAGLRLGYTVNRQLDLNLNINNLFDRYYYSSIGADNGPNFFGDPRNVMLTARYRF